MSVRATWELDCDHPGCTEAFPAPYRATASAYTIRTAAAREGWHATSRGRTFCPGHKPRTRAKKT